MNAPTFISRSKKKNNISGDKLSCFYLRICAFSLRYGSGVTVAPKTKQKKNGLHSTARFRQPRFGCPASIPTWRRCNPRMKNNELYLKIMVTTLLTVGARTGPEPFTVFYGRRKQSHAIYGAAEDAAADAKNRTSYTSNDSNRSLDAFATLRIV